MRTPWSTRSRSSRELPNGPEWPSNGCSTSPEAHRDASRSGAAVDVVILTWNDGPLLDRAIESVAAAHFDGTRIIVVDNGSDEAPPLPFLPGFTLVRNAKNRGVAAARNQGAAVGDAPYVLLLDSDARLEPECLSTLVDVLDRNPAIGLAAPVFTDQVPEASGGRAPSIRRKLARGLGLTASYRGVTRHRSERWWNVEFTIGACQLVRREAWEQIGGLDESYFYGPEDLDFCLRLRAAGRGVVQVGDARCFHPPRRRNRSLFKPGGARHAGALLRHYTHRLQKAAR